MSSYNTDFDGDEMNLHVPSISIPADVDQRLWLRDGDEVVINTTSSAPIPTNTNHIISSTTVNRIVVRLYSWNHRPYVPIDIPNSSPVATHIRNLWKLHHLELTSKFGSLFMRAKDLITRSDKLYHIATQRNFFNYDDYTIFNQIKFSTLRIMCQRIGSIYPMINYNQLLVVLDALSIDANISIKGRTDLLQKIRERYETSYKLNRDRLVHELIDLTEDFSTEMENKKFYLVPTSDFSNLEMLCHTISIINLHADSQIKMKNRGAEMSKVCSWLAECGWPPKDNESTYIQKYKQTYKLFRDYIKIFNNYLVQTVYNIRQIRLQTYVTTHVHFYLKDLANIVIAYAGNELISLSVDGDEIIRIPNLMTHLLNGRIITKEHSMQLGIFMRNELCKGGDRPKVNVVIENDTIIPVFKYTIVDLPTMIKVGLTWIKDCLLPADELCRLMIEQQNEANERVLMKQAEIESTNMIWRKVTNQPHKNLIHDCNSPLSTCCVDCHYKNPRNVTTRIVGFIDQGKCPKCRNRTSFNKILQESPLTPSIEYIECSTCHHRCDPYPHVIYWDKDMPSPYCTCVGKNYTDCDIHSC